MKEDDRNTSFFYKMANAHRRRNTMAKVKVNEVSFTEEADIREGITQAFQSLLLEPLDLSGKGMVCCTMEHSKLLNNRTKTAKPCSRRLFQAI